MNSNDIRRMHILMSKIVADQASFVEQKELQVLYHSFIHINVSLEKKRQGKREVNA